MENEKERHSIPISRKVVEEMKLIIKNRGTAMFVKMSDREKKILEMRFGLKDDKSYTLDEVGKKFGVTPERVRQIEARAIQKIRDLM